MTKNSNTQNVYLIRHASPDWSRTDIPYDIPPGPPLTSKGHQEAQALGVFLKNAGLKKLYYSPLERSAHTAQIAATVAGVPVVEQSELAEWRKGETEPEIQARFWPLLEASLEESALVGPLGLVTHGGPVAYLLKQLGIEPARLEKYRQMFDHTNPLPPAGVWAVQRNSSQEGWDLQLVFTPPQIS
jgi:2,3-bisphosphoglycerate-dependent phosphoglycerate mutase